LPFFLNYQQAKKGLHIFISTILEKSLFRGYWYW